NALHGRTIPENSHLDLDPLIQRKLKDWLIDFVNGDGTVFLSTHILDLAEKLCTRVGIIDQGKLVAVGWSCRHNFRNKGHQHGCSLVCVR
ncbi:MAG: hypothetical protein MIO93_06520, partial [ANME-2 cluster archaeon]|nr:hypothetical protein [ANME-2 cluster archaeon]